MTLKGDPHFDEFVNEIKDIQSQVDKLLLGSVFLRKPRNVEAEQVPHIPEGTSLEGSLELINNLLHKNQNLEDRLKQLLDDQNTASYADQIEDYLRDIEEAQKALLTLKPILIPEHLRDGETGKTDVSWLSWQRTKLASKLHKEILSLQEATEDETQSREELEAKLSTVDALIKTADALHESSQYLSWFNRKVVQLNEKLPEFERDFTTGLVSQWVMEEANRVMEHHNNCVNVRAEMEEKLQTLGQSE